MAAGLVRLGVDIGGTNTDAVILRDNQVLGWFKARTTEGDVREGLEEAIKGAVAQASEAHGIKAGDISLCMLGTTHFVNALVQRRGLALVAVLRIGLPATSDLPPFSDIPHDLIVRLGGGAFRLVHGGLEYDGETEISRMDDSEILHAAKELIEVEGYKSLVVVGVFSPLAPTKQEDYVCSLINANWPHVVVTASHVVSPQLGLLERENAAILNACLRPLASRLLPQCLAAFTSCLGSGTGPCPLFLTSNDGTLLSLQAAAALPIATFQSGPVNSIRGAAYLCQNDPSFTPDPGRNLVVIDVGGTTTDFGLVASTTSRGGMTSDKGLGSSVTIAQQHHVSYMGGVRTNLALPAIQSIGLGGGSLVTRLSGTGRVKVGPESVGSELLEKCRSAGGSELVATDIAVALGSLDYQALGLSEVAPLGIEKGLLEGAWDAIQAMVEEGLEGAKTKADPVDVMVVGGGACLVGATIKGSARLWRPMYGHVANAIGAAIPQVGQTLDQVVIVPPMERTQVLQRLELDAIEKVVAAGGLRGTCKVTWREEVPLAYLPGHATRVRMRVVADLDTSRLPGVQELEAFIGDADPSTETSRIHHEPSGDSQDIHARDWAPIMDDRTGEWLLTFRDVKAIAIGAGVLGAGGGGSPYLAELKLLRGMKERGQVPRVIQARFLGDDSMVIEGSTMGAPTVTIEKLSAGEAQKAFLAAAETCLQGKKVDAVMIGEVGGGNGLEPLSIGLHLGLPVVDADLMGRASPELHMMTSSIYGLATTPATLADERGNSVIVSNTSSPQWLETLLRPVCTAMGCSAGFSSRPLTGRQVKEVGVGGSLSLAWRIGRAVMQAESKDKAAQAIIGVAGGTVLFGPGKIVDVDRCTEEGFARGHVIVEDSGTSEGGGGRSGERFRVVFQNENLVAYREEDMTGGAVTTLCCVPDLIVFIETSSGLPLQTEDLRYGLRVVVLGLPCHPLLRTPQALAVVGPQAFGYPDVRYEPLPLNSHGAPCLWPLGPPRP